MLKLGACILLLFADIFCKADVGSNEDNLGGDPEGSFFKSLGLFDTINGSSVASGIRWNYGIVPYRVNTRYYDALFARQVQSVLRYISAVSCIKFLPIEHKPCSSQWWLHFVNPQAERGCGARPRFSPSGEIFVVVGYDCMQRRQVLQAALRGLGMADMVTHPLRAKYINVLYDNVHPDYATLFDVAPDFKFGSTPYSPSSVTHLHPYAYSYNGKPTIVPRTRGVDVEPAKDLSQTDIAMLHEHFSKECNKRYLTKLFESCKLAMRGDSKRNCTMVPQCDGARGPDSFNQTRMAIELALRANSARDH